MVRQTRSRKTISCQHEVLGRAVRELRVRRDFSQEELGQHGGLHRNYIGAIERGEINPTLTTLLKLERGLSFGLNDDRDFNLSGLILLFDARRAGTGP